MPTPPTITVKEFREILEAHFRLIAIAEHMAGMQPPPKPPASETRRPSVVLIDARRCA